MSRIAGILMLVGILAFICGFDARYVIGLLALGEVIGDLCELIQKQVEITLTPPEAESQRKAA